MTTSNKYPRATDGDVRKKFDVALHIALFHWQLGTGQTLRPWLYGYCGEFAKIVANFVGGSAELGSVLANDGRVHHMVAVVGNLVIDARGVNTKDSLIAEI